MEIESLQSHPLSTFMKIELRHILIYRYCIVFIYNSIAHIILIQFYNIQNN